MDQTASPPTGKAAHKGLLRRALWHRFRRIFIKNPIDREIEKSLLAFGSSLNAGVLRQQPTALQLVLMLIRHTVELAELERMYLKTLVPQARKSIRRYNTYAKKSFYLQILKRQKNYEGNLEEIIRLAYVHLYHKFENFQVELISALNAHFSALYHTPVDLQKYLADTYAYRLKDLKNQPAPLQTINWISNCVKHKNGYPLKEPVPERFAGVNRSEKIIISPETLRQDMEFLLQYFQDLCTTYMAVGMAQYVNSLVGKRDPSKPATRQVIKELHANTPLHLSKLTGRFSDK